MLKYTLIWQCHVGSLQIFFIETLKCHNFQSKDPIQHKILHTIMHNQAPWAYINKFIYLFSQKFLLVSGEYGSRNIFADDALRWP